MALFWGSESYAFFNDACAELFDESGRAAFGRPYSDVDGELWSGALTMARRVYESGITLEAKDQRFDPDRDGTRPPSRFDVSYSPITDECGEVAGVLCVFSGTTTRAHDENEGEDQDRYRRALESRFELLASSIQEVFYLTDLDSSRLIYVSPAYERVWGRSTEELYADLRAYTRAIHPGDVPRATAALLDQMRGKPTEVEYRIVRPDGEVRWIYDRSYPAKESGRRLAAGIAEDITRRRSVEIALRESEARVKRALHVARVGTFAWDLATDGVTLDERSREIFGFGRDQDCCAQDVFDRIHPDDFPAVHAAAMASAESLSRLEIGYRLKLPDGRIRSIESLSDVIAGGDGIAQRLVGVFDDVTERERAERSLREGEARLRELNETLAQRVEAAIADRDRTWNYSRDLLLVVGTDDIMRAVNPAWSTILGWDADDLVGRHQSDFIHPEDQASSSRALAMTRLDGSPSLENRCLHKDGSYRWIAWVAAPEGELIYASGRDVTADKARSAELQAAEAARREADALYRAYFENTAESLFVIGVQTDGSFTIEDLNASHQASTQLRLDAVIGKRIDEVLPPESAALVMSHYRHVLTTGQIYEYRETFQLHGETTHWDTVLVPVRDETGRIVRLIGSSRDLTRQLAAEEQLRQSQKMEAMGQLTGGVAHDFNNLLTPIVSVLDMLQRRGLSDTREQRLVVAAAKSAERAKILVQRLLAFARRQPLQPVAVDVAKLVRDMSEIVSSTTGPQIRVVVEATDNLPPAKADPNQLEMALLNLTVNARDAMPDGGILRISAAADTVRSGTTSTLRSGRYVRLAVADTGMGMDEATLARAVEPFFSTKGVGKGTGLGLSMVHGLASQLGGALKIKSKPGLGTSVELWLPQSREAPSSDSTARPFDAMYARGTALLVEDEDLVRLSTADMLEDLGYRVIQAPCAEAALSTIRDETQLDLLVTDHLMPGMTGMDFAHLVRDLRPGLPILLVSGFAHVEGIASNVARLSKPFRRDELASSIAALSSTTLRKPEQPSHPTH